MPKKLCNNEYGFSVAEHNPFFIFPYLQEVVKKHFSASEVLDLSRGDPGLGFCPSARSRGFYSFLVAVDTVLNCNHECYRIHLKTEADLPEIEAKIKKFAEDNYVPKVAAAHLQTFDEVLEKIQNYAKAEQCAEFSRFEAISGIFQRSTLVGGSYHTPWGEPIVKVVVAGMYRALLRDTEICSSDFIFTLGVNDAIGTIFKMLGAEGIGFLKKGDTIAASTPAYAPYFNEFNSRGLNVVEIPSDIPNDPLDDLVNSKEKIKAIFLITPNNPTGIKYSPEQLKKIAEVAEKHDALIVTDEIYAQFHADFQSIWGLAKKRTLRLCGRSKIERSPGLRFGDVLICQEANEYLTNHLFKGSLNDAPDFRTFFIWMKAPGGTFASFQHTASVPGPSQILGMLHILLGAEERTKYLAAVNKNMEAFFEGLGVPRNAAMYYGLIDLNTVPNGTKKAVSIDQKLHDLCTQKGVILIPALKFFSEAAQKISDKSHYIRVSLPNLSLEQTKDAAKRIREYLTS